MGRDVSVQAQDEALVFCGWYVVNPGASHCCCGDDREREYILTMLMS